MNDNIKINPIAREIVSDDLSFSDNYNATQHIAKKFDFPAGRIEAIEAQYGFKMLRLPTFPPITPYEIVTVPEGEHKEITLTGAGKGIIGLMKTNPELFTNRLDQSCRN